MNPTAVLSPSSAKGPCVIMPDTETATTGQANKNRRLYPRKDVALRVDYADTHGRANWSITKDLSGGGMFIAHTPGLSPGDTLVTAFALPTGQPYRFHARVVHTNAHGIGLEFLDRYARYEDTYIDHLDAYCAA